MGKFAENLNLEKRVLPHPLPFLSLSDYLFQDAYIILHKIY